MVIVNVMLTLTVIADLIQTAKIIHRIVVMYLLHVHVGPLHMVGNVMPVIGVMRIGVGVIAVIMVNAEIVISMVGVTNVTVYTLQVIPVMEDFMYG